MDLTTSQEKCYIADFQGKEKAGDKHRMLQKLAQCQLYVKILNSINNVQL